MSALAPFSWRVAQDARDSAFLIALDLKAGFLNQPIRSRYETEVDRALRMGLPARVARAAVKAGFAEVFEGWQP
jgi:hypothetical protein